MKKREESTWKGKKVEERKKSMKKGKKGMKIRKEDIRKGQKMGEKKKRVEKRKER